jgi:hypothetical protein
MVVATELLTLLRDQAHRRSERQRATYPTLTLLITAAIEQTLRSTAADLDAVAVVLGAPQYAARIVEPAVAASTSLVKHASEAALTLSSATEAALDWMVTTCEK